MKAKAQKLIYSVYASDPNSRYSEIIHSTASMNTAIKLAQDRVSSGYVAVEIVTWKVGKPWVMKGIDRLN